MKFSETNLPWVVLRWSHVRWPSCKLGSFLPLSLLPPILDVFAQWSQHPFPSQAQQQLSISWVVFTKYSETNLPWVVLRLSREHWPSLIEALVISSSVTPSLPIIFARWSQHPFPSQALQKLSYILGYLNEVQWNQPTLGSFEIKSWALAILQAWTISFLRDSFPPILDVLFDGAVEENWPPGSPRQFSLSPNVNSGQWSRYHQWESMRIKNYFKNHYSYTALYAKFSVSLYSSYMCTCTYVYEQTNLEGSVLSLVSHNSVNSL